MQKIKPTYEELEIRVLELNNHIHFLAEQIRILKHQAFGRRTERFIPDGQGSLFALPEVTAPEVSKTTVAQHERVKRPGRKPLPDNLPRERVE